MTYDRKRNLENLGTSRIFSTADSSVYKNRRKALMEQLTDNSLDPLIPFLESEEASERLKLAGVSPQL